MTNKNKGLPCTICLFVCPGASWGDSLLVASWNHTGATLRNTPECVYADGVWLVVWEMDNDIKYSRTTDEGMSWSKPACLSCLGELANETSIRCVCGPFLFLLRALSFCARSPLRACVLPIVAFVLCAYVREPRLVTQYVNNTLDRLAMVTYTSIRQYSGK